MLIYEGKTFKNIASKGSRDGEFENCSFVNCDFSNGVFTSGKFTDCVLTNCNLALAKLGQCQLNDVTFKDCKLLGLNFCDCSDFLFTVKFENCILDYSSFARKKMAKTHFLNSSLRNVDFTDSDLSKAVFANDDLTNAVFNKTTIKEADFLTARNYSIDPEKNNVKKARFSLYGVIGLLNKYDIRVE